jgi:hypothetical protein
LQDKPLDVSPGEFPGNVAGTLFPPAAKLLFDLVVNRVIDFALHLEGAPELNALGADDMRVEECEKALHVVVILRQIPRAPS